jgi:hypothetical protein
VAHSLNNLAADIYKAADTVGRELVGFIPSVTINGDATLQAAKGDTIRAHFTRTPSVSTTYTPSMTIPEGTDQTVDNKTMTLDTFANVQIPITGEEVKHLNNGSGYDSVFGDMFEQAIRAITNKIEVDIGLAAYVGSSRAFGQAGTAPFGSNFNEIAEIRQILVDNGCPMDGNVSLVLNTLAGTNLRQLAQLQKVNEAGDGGSMLRQGELLNLQGLRLRESAGVASHVAGAGTGYDFIAAGEAIGQTVLSVEGGTVNSTGIKAGDIITHAGDTVNKYVVNTGLAATSGDIVIGSPGLRVAGVDANEITIGGSYAANLAFHRSAVELGIRPIAVPNGGDAADDMMTIQDPHSGLVYTVAVYKGYKKAMYEVSCLYGIKAWKPDFIATLLG